MKRTAWVLALALGAAWVRPCGAQEFAAPSPAFARSFEAMLDRGLAPDTTRLAATALLIRWHGLAELDTRSLAAGAAWKRARFAAGLSRTGELDLGWSAAAVAVGMGERRGGAAVRSCARERRGEGGRTEFGAEVGAGAWLSASSWLDLWAAAPQLWTRGDPPPIERWLEIGGRARIGELDLWLAREITRGRPRGLAVEHRAGARAWSGLLELWIEARDRPLRGTFGLAAAVGPARVATTIESHPVLGETVRLALGYAGARRR